jgi:ribonuclease HII
VGILRDFDLSYNKIVAGVDEAGRGPLAGPVVAAAVIIENYSEEFEAINDSKKLTEKKREELYPIIIKNCKVGVGVIECDRIDEINILNATFEAMKIAVESIEANYDIVLVDGNKKIKGFEGNQECIVKGDGKSLSIAAASIVAKVTRDRILHEMAKNHPQYNFEKHKGYGTKVHVEKILEHGPCKEHRKTFLKKILRVVSNRL